MAKGITEATKFIRTVMAQEIENPANQPYTVGKGADLVAFLRTVASEMLEDDWVSRYGIDVPEGWRTPQGKFGERDAAGNHTQANKKAVKYRRKISPTDAYNLQNPASELVATHCQSTTILDNS